MRDSNGINDISNKHHADDVAKVPRALVNLPSDLMGGAAASPRTISNALEKWSQSSDGLYHTFSDSFPVRKTFETNAGRLMKGWEQKKGGYAAAGTSAGFEIRQGAETGSMVQSGGWLSTPAIPLAMTLSPVYEAAGKPSWRNMQRRAKTLVHRYPTMLDLEGPDFVNHRVADGVAPSVFRLVRKWQMDRKNPDQKKLRVTVVGHSMGTIVLNETFRAMNRDSGSKDSCHVEIDRIIYMGAACSIRDFNDSAGRYLENHGQAEMYNLCLHPTREISERWKPSVPIVYAGSLLCWIDQFFENPRDFYDRTFGSFENCVIAHRYMPQTKRFHLKSFDWNPSFFNKEQVGSGPQKHGEFDSFRFWDENFYSPAGNAPYVLVDR